MQTETAQASMTLRRAKHLLMPSAYNIEPDRNFCRNFSPWRLMPDVDPFHAAGISFDPEYRQSDVLIKPSLSAAPRVQPEPAVLFLFKIPVGVPEDNDLAVPKI